MLQILKNHKIIIAIILIMMTYLVGGVVVTSDIVIMIISLSWLLFWYWVGFDQKFFLGLSFLSLFLTYPLFISGHVLTADKFAKWQFIFILIAFVAFIISDIKSRVKIKR